MASRASKMYAKETEGVTKSRENVNATKAAKILEANKRNRPYSRALAVRYAEDMLIGDWHYNGQQVIIFDVKDHTHNMQHTLNAIIIAQKRLTDDPDSYPFWGDDDISIPLDFTRGIDLAAVDTIDLGKTRSVSDVFYREGHFNKVGDMKVSDRDSKKLHKWLATALRLVWARSHGETGMTRKKFTQRSAFEFLSKHPRMIDAVSEIFILNDEEAVTNEETGEVEPRDTNRIGSLVSPAYAAGMLYLFAMSDTTEEQRLDETMEDGQWDNAVEFWRLFSLKEGDAGSGPKWAVNKLTADKGNKKAHDRNRVCTILCEAWNAFKEDSAVKESANKRLKKADYIARVGGIDVEPPETPDIVAEAEDETEAETAVDDAA